jgi:hypothetical protein
MNVIDILLGIVGGIIFINMILVAKRRHVGDKFWLLGILCMFFCISKFYNLIGFIFNYWYLH